MSKYLVLLILVSCSSKKHEKQEPPAAPAKDPAPGSSSAPSSAPAPSTPPSTTPPAPAPSSTPPSAGSGTLSPAVAAANAFADAVALTCKQQASEVKGSEGTSYFMKCPDCPDRASVWGTDRYTDDSNVCAAAVHAGAMPRQGGSVLVTWIPGLPTYIGSTRNGITSSSYGKWGRSFYVQAVDAKGVPTTPPPPPLPAGVVLFDCAMAMDIVGGNVVRVLCPPGCTHGSLWGTDTYTGDSSVCLAAVHAGILTADKGGEVTVTKGGAKDAFPGSARNGVTSSSYEHFDHSFTVAK